MMEEMKEISPGKWEEKKEEPKCPDNYKAWRGGSRWAAGSPGWPHCRLSSLCPRARRPPDAAQHLC